MVKYCTICGSPNEDNANFCTKCGNKFPLVPNTAFQIDNNKSKIIFESQVKRAIPIYSLSSIFTIYRNWYSKPSTGLLTKFLVTLFFLILSLGSLGVISPFIPFQIIFLIIFFKYWLLSWFSDR
ncbi:zinc-ribbon domain-containing protein [Sulfolobus islandicus]|uniref:zinc-ribbon domain-containing protein n=1 Tax=Saccharolobus islandicus TaxID=43080 RepID=UPI00069966A9|nr:zinc-ribbon domain-containing protein [Sulfolobus islandicus]